MKKIYESPLNGWDESAERIHIYALDENDDWWEFDAMTEEDWCNYFNMYNDYSVAPGAIYHRYHFNLENNHIVITENIAYNI
jgi:hypothetical protein